MTTHRKLVAYTRVRERQSEEEQRETFADLAALEAYARRRKYQLIAAFVDQFGSKRTPRPELDKAIALCRETGARLVIARLGSTGADPGIYEELHLAQVNFLVLEDRNLSAETVLQKGMSVYRADPRAKT